jgi:phosphatidylserine decarboxylase
MLKPSVGVALEGLPYIIIAAFATLIFAIIGCWPVAVLGLAATAFIGHFFRDPERVGPEDAEAVAAPADGKVIKVGRAVDPMTGDSRQYIAIFMNVFNVHVNRKVETIRYIPGKFFNASFDKASEDNERNIVVITGKGNQRFTMVQIAGLIARRIVCWAEPGDKLKRGERYGLIKFGSRVDLYIPDGYVPTVSVGQKTVAGETVLAEKRSA